MQSKDFVNHRYLRKRASFLTFVAKELRKNSLVEDVKFTYHHGNMMRPVVILTPSGIIFFKSSSVDITSEN